MEAFCLVVLVMGVVHFLDMLKAIIGFWPSLALAIVVGVPSVAWLDRRYEIRRKTEDPT